MSPTQIVRDQIAEYVDTKKLSSLDELMGTIFTIISVCFALLTIIFIDFRIAFSFVTVILTGFFWVGYRIAKILHAIDLRIWIIKAFIEFILGVLLIIISFFFNAILGFHENIAVSVGFALYFVLQRIIRPSNQGMKLWKWLVTSESQHIFQKKGFDGWLINNISETTAFFHLMYSFVPLYILLTIFTIGDLTVGSFLANGIVLLYGFILWMIVRTRLYQSKAQAIQSKIIPEKRKPSKKHYIIFPAAIAVFIGAIMSFIEDLALHLELLRISLGVIGIIAILSITYDLKL